MPYENNKGVDQSAHPRSRISTFVVCCLESIILLDAISEISRHYLASVAEQAGLSFTWLQTPKVRFSHDTARLVYRFFSSCIGTVKILKIRTPQIFAAIALKFEQDGFTIELHIQKMQTELQAM